MNLALRKPTTLAEFLEWEERQPLRYEFDGVGPVAITGGTAGHAVVQRNLAIAVGGRLRGKPCRFYGSGLKFQVAEGHVRYPDGMVVCRPVDRTATVVYDPVIVFEVLSPSTGRDDRIVKAREYQATPSVQRYVMLEQDGVSRPSTSAPAMPGRTKSWSPTPFSPCLRSVSNCHSPSSTTALSLRRSRTPIGPPTAPDLPRIVLIGFGISSGSSSRPGDCSGADRTPEARPSPPQAASNWRDRGTSRSTAGEKGAMVGPEENARWKRVVCSSSRASFWTRYAFND